MAVWSPGELSKSVSVLDGGDCSMAANSISFEGSLTVEPNTARLLLNGIEIVARCVNFMEK